MPCQATNKQGQPCRAPAMASGYCRIHGDGLKQKIKDKAVSIATKANTIAKRVLPTAITRRVDNILEGPRHRPTGRLQKFLDGHPNKITKIQVGRKPILKPVHAALDALSLGRFTKKSKELGYGEVYHNYMLVTLDDGRTYKLEKNALIEEKPAKQSDYANELFEVPLHGKQLTLPEMFANASRGKSNFYHYRGFDGDNCQAFTRAMVEANDLMPEGPAPEHLEPQNMQPVLQAFPTLTRPVPQAVTDLAEFGDRVIHGDGLPGIGNAYRLGGFFGQAGGALFSSPAERGFDSVPHTGRGVRRRSAKPDKIPPRLLGCPI